MRAHKMNDIVRGKVSRLATFGAFVELAEGIEGLCHMSEIEEKRRKHEEGANSAPGRNRRHGTIRSKPARNTTLKS